MRGGARSLIWALPIALLIATLWLFVNPPLPHQTTSDLYTHLSVARHVARGDGFLCDVTYPLSFAFPWARELPQPLIHRPPGYALLLAPLHPLAGGDPRRTLELVRWLMAVIMATSFWFGVAAYARRGRLVAAWPWLLIWLINPLISFVYGWGQVEAVAGLLLLTLWLRWRRLSDDVRDGTDRFVLDPLGPLPGWLVDGTLWAALTLMRPELFWLPLLWWWGHGWRSRARPQPASASAITAAPASLPASRRQRWRDPLLALAIWCALMTPWAGRNWHLTGDPFFSLQRHAEHLKRTRNWPGYTIYRSLEPETMLQTMASDPEPVVRKTLAAVYFFLQHLGDWLPWSLLAACVALWLARRRWRAIPGDPLFLVGLTGASMIFLYAPFDRELRHLVPLWPIATWEIFLLAADALAGSERRRFRLPPWLQSGLLLFAVVLATWLTPARVPGWEHATRIAAREARRVAVLVEQAEELPPGAVFCDNAEVLWLTERAGVWEPLDDATEAEIRRLVPDLTHAPWLRLKLP